MNVGELKKRLEDVPETLNINLVLSYDNCKHIQPLNHVTVFESKIFDGEVYLHGSKE